MSNDIGKPVYLGNELLPGILIQTDPEIEICSGVHIKPSEADETVPSINYSLLTVKRGIPRLLSPQEALMRYFLCYCSHYVEKPYKSGIKIFKRIFRSYTSQKEALENLLESLGWDGEVRWVRDIFGETVAPVLGKDADGTWRVLMYFYPDSKTSDFKSRTLRGSCSVMKFDDISDMLIEPSDALKLCFTGICNLCTLHKMYDVDTEILVQNVWNNIVKKENQA